MDVCGCVNACMGVCAHVCVYVCMGMHVCVWVGVYVHYCMRVCVHASMHVWWHPAALILGCEWMSVGVDAHVWVYVGAVSIHACM